MQLCLHRQSGTVSFKELPTATNPTILSAKALTDKEIGL
jgi:hypothetical protein